MILFWLTLLKPTSGHLNRLAEHTEPTATESITSTLPLKKTLR